MADLYQNNYLLNEVLRFICESNVLAYKLLNNLKFHVILIKSECNPPLIVNRTCNFIALTTQ